MEYKIMKAVVAVDFSTGTGTATIEGDPTASVDKVSVFLKYAEENLKHSGDSFRFECTYFVSSSGRVFVRAAKVLTDAKAAHKADEPVKPKATRKPKSNGPLFFISNENQSLLTAAALLADMNGRSVVIIAGPSGFGKSTLAQNFATDHNRPFFKIDSHTVRDPEEWFFTRQIRDGASYERNTLFADAIMTPNAVILIDEVNRVEPYIINPMLPLLDDFGYISTSSGTFRVAPGVIFFLTANLGFQYSGTYEIDEAIANRADIVIDVSSIPLAEEVKVVASRTGVSEPAARFIVNAMRDMRGKVKGIDLSTRAAIKVASLVVVGLPMNLAFSSIYNRVSGEDRRRIVDLVAKYVVA